MEVLVTEEKKKIFRARKTMKISDRHQLENLHSTLLTATPGLSNPSPPPVMNGTHKEDGQRAGEKEQNNVSGSNTPRAQSPASLTSLSSPAPFLSLNLSPSPPSSHSPKGQDETSSPTSPFNNLTFGLNQDGEEKNKCLPPSSKDSVTPTSTECMEQEGKDPEVVSGAEEKDKATTPMEQAVDLAQDSTKGSASCLPAQPPVSNYTEPMDADSDSTNTMDPEPSTENIKDEKPSSPKLSTSDCPSSSGPSHPASSCTDQKQTLEIKEDDVKKEEVDKDAVKKRSSNDTKMEVDSLKVEPKKLKDEIGQSTRKLSRPSSTPPSNTVKEEKSSTSGLKRTLSEGYEKDEPPVKKEGKKMKMDRRDELEAQLEVKITAKAGSHTKLEKIVQQLVEERMRVMELTIFDKHFQELKDRVDKIDCATKHQAAINTLQAKIARLAKKFGEANQASENKRKQEVLAAAAAAAKAASAGNSPQAQRVLRRQTVGPRPEAPSEGVVPSVGKTPPLSVKKEKEEEEMEEDKTDMSRHVGMARKLSDYSEGRCRADIKLRAISSQLENVLYHNCKRSSGDPRPDRYASYVFRYLVPYDVYCDWVAKVNYVGLLGKEALPRNLRRTLRMYIEQRFPFLSCDKWREIRDAINEILRVKRRPEFFREYNDQTVVSS